MKNEDIIAILKDTENFRLFLSNNPEFDIVSKSLNKKDISHIQEEYSELNLFPYPLEKVSAVTLVSRVLMQNGYPKLKAYIDELKKEVIHIFYSG